MLQRWLRRSCHNTTCRLREGAEARLGGLAWIQWGWNVCCRGWVEQRQHAPPRVDSDYIKKTRLCDKLQVSVFQAYYLIYLYVYIFFPSSNLLMPLLQHSAWACRLHVAEPTPSCSCRLQAAGYRVWELPPSSLPKEPASGLGWATHHCQLLQENWLGSTWLWQFLLVVIQMLLTLHVVASPWVLRETHALLTQFPLPCAATWGCQPLSWT